MKRDSRDGFTIEAIDKASNELRGSETESKTMVDEKETTTAATVEGLIVGLGVALGGTVGVALGSAVCVALGVALGGTVGVALGIALG